ncbi:hypothetical protein ACJJIL_07890 [Microbulbifer sp. EKSA005]|uniref:hypothetical protein n=1 Tax=Microbulbifer sp. EKSA005 TaxID=3243364 RepID=UPI004041611C
MIISCDHCGEVWEFADKALPNIQKITRNFSERRITASLIKALSGELKLPMLYSKNFANHLTMREGCCFYCQEPLGIEEAFIKHCRGCGALNLDRRFA